MSKRIEWFVWEHRKKKRNLTRNRDSKVFHLMQEALLWRSCGTPSASGIRKKKIPYMWNIREKLEELETKWGRRWWLTIEKMNYCTWRVAFHFRAYGGWRQHDWNSTSSWSIGNQLEMENGTLTMSHGATNDGNIRNNQQMMTSNHITTDSFRFVFTLFADVTR